MDHSERYHCPQCGLVGCIEFDFFRREYRCRQCSHVKPITWEDGTFEELVNVHGLKKVVEYLFKKMKK